MHSPEYKKHLAMSVLGRGFRKPQLNIKGKSMTKSHIHVFLISVWLYHMCEAFCFTSVTEFYVYVYGVGEKQEDVHRPFMSRLTWNVDLPDGSVVLCYKDKSFGLVFSADFVICRRQPWTESIAEIFPVILKNQGCDSFWLIKELMHMLHVFYESYNEQPCFKSDLIFFHLSICILNYLFSNTRSIHLLDLFLSTVFPLNLMQPSSLPPIDFSKVFIMMIKY